MMPQGTKPGPGKVQALSLSLRAVEVVNTQHLHPCGGQHYLSTTLGKRLDATSVIVYDVNLHFPFFAISYGMLINHFVNSWSMLGKIPKNNKNKYRKKFS